VARKERFLSSRKRADQCIARSVLKRREVTKREDF